MAASDESTKWDKEVAQLVEMGFVSRIAYEALLRTNGDVEKAIGLLTRKPYAHHPCARRYRLRG